MSREHEAYLEFQREADHEAYRAYELLREHVALALRNADAKYHGWPEVDDLYLTEKPDFYLDMARAAISAIRQEQ